MEKWELIKKNISKEIQETINTIDPAFDLDSSLNLYSKILKFQISIQTVDKLNGLSDMIHKSLEEPFLNGKMDIGSIGSFCKNFEQFIKKIYYVLEEGQFIERKNILDHTKHNALLPFLSSLNKVKSIYLDEDGNEVYDVDLAFKVDGVAQAKKNPQTGLKMFRRLFSSSISFDKYFELDDIELNDKYENQFALYLIKAVILKNVQSHQAPGHNLKENIRNLNITLIAELFIINFFKKELEISIRQRDFDNKNVNAFIVAELDKLDKQSSKFVSLNLKKLTNQKIDETSGFIESLLEQNVNRMRLLGQGGSGKTTTLEYLFVQDAKKWLESPANSKIPVLISLANLSSKETIAKSIAKKINIEIDYIEELLETNGLKIYLDGINEILENRESKKNKLQEISTLIDEYPDLYIVITDRYEFDKYQNSMFNVPTYLIQKLNKGQIEEFVKKYCNKSDDQSSKVLKILKQKENIQDLFLRPLVLTRAIEIIKSENDLPEKEGKIIEKFVDVLLKREKNEKKDPLLNINNFKLMLAYAANDIWAKNKSNAPIHEFRFNKLLVAAAEEFGLEKFNAGYISRIGYELEILSKTDDLIQFFHQSYIEFFCKHFLKYELK